jgi:diaminopimelate epimerase
VKAHGTGNDFVLLPDPDDRIVLDANLVRALCDRHRGVGGDGVIRVGPARDGADGDVFMDYWNADGSVAEMCGNGVRCVAKYVVDRGQVGDTVRVDTRGGIKAVEVVARHPDKKVAAVRVDMGAPQPGAQVTVDLSPLRVARSPWAPGPVPDSATAEQRLVSFLTLSMGNPHAVTVVDDVEQAALATWGPVVEHDAAFPGGTNVEFIAVPARDRVVGRIWERGVGETMASGTGASAMAVAAHLLGHADRHVTVELPGGELEVDWTAQTLYVTGPAVEVAAGELDAAWLEEVRRDG